MTKVVPPLIVALVVGLAVPLFAQLSRDAAIAKAEAILENLQDGKTAEIVKGFDARLTQDLPETKLKAAWPGLSPSLAPSRRLPIDVRG